MNRVYVDVLFPKTQNTTRWPRKAAKTQLSFRFSTRMSDTASAKTTESTNSIKNILPVCTPWKSSVSLVDEVRHSMTGCVCNSHAGHKKFLNCCDWLVQTLFKPLTLFRLSWPELNVASRAANVTKRTPWMEVNKQTFIPNIQTFWLPRSRWLDELIHQMHKTNKERLRIHWKVSQFNKFSLDLLKRFWLLVRKRRCKSRLRQPNQCRKRMIFSNVTTRDK